MRMSGGSSDVVSADLRGRFEWRARTRCSALSNPPPASRKDKAMAQPGDFTRTETGYSGRIRTLSLDAELPLVPAEPSAAETAPEARTSAVSGMLWSVRVALGGRRFFTKHIPTN